mmetsp:Transcript_5838/g.17260  ORF Transcript_5838/g.17260 Transcript_5838/m.17260 type:complete len:261 (+) Transcript_5838:441-1223(+)
MSRARAAVVKLQLFSRSFISAMTSCMSLVSICDLSSRGACQTSITCLPKATKPFPSSISPTTRSWPVDSSTCSSSSAWCSPSASRVLSMVWTLQRGQSPMSGSTSARSSASGVPSRMIRTCDATSSTWPRQPPTWPTAFMRLLLRAQRTSPGAMTSSRHRDEVRAGRSSQCEECERPLGELAVRTRASSCCTMARPEGPPWRGLRRCPAPFCTSCRQRSRASGESSRELPERVLSVSEPLSQLASSSRQRRSSAALPSQT